MGRVSRHCAAALWDEMVPPMDLRPAACGLGGALTLPVQDERVEAALGRMEGRRSDGSCRQPRTGRQMKLSSRKVTLFPDLGGIRLSSGPDGPGPPSEVVISDGHYVSYVRHPAKYIRRPTV